MNEIDIHTPVQEAAFSTQEVQELARNDLDFLAALVMPTIFRFCFPPVLKAVWQWLLSEGGPAPASTAIQA